MRAKKPTLRAKLLATLAAVLLPGLPAVAGPLDPPPPDTVRAWIIEWAGGTTPRVQNGEIIYTFGRSDGILAVVGFDVIGGRRELYAGDWSGGAFAADQGVYPSVWVNGQQMLPPCPARAACEHPRTLTTTMRIDGNIPGRRSYYVIARNYEVEKITTSPGWKPPRELKQKLEVRLVEPRGSGAHIPGFGGVEHFTGASAPGGRYGSYAVTLIHCGMPGGQGSIVLTGGDPSPKRPGDNGTRHDECDSSLPSEFLFAHSAANRQTTWRVDGEVTSRGGNPNRLVVVDLPRFPS